jgi:hypothetical protein
MISLMKTFAVLPVAAVLALPLAIDHASAQQNVDAIRAQCLAKAGAAYPGQDPARDMHGSARMAAYSSCMREHGLKP